MIDYKQLNKEINKYLNNKSQNNFFNLRKELIKYKFPKWKIEKLIDLKENIPFMHLAYFYLWSERLLEASFYFKKYLDDNIDDCQVWIELQYISAKRGDLHTSSKALEQITRLGKDYQIYRGHVIHNLARGAVDIAVKYAKKLTETGIKDNFNLLILYEIAIVAKKWEFISWIIKSRKGKEILKNSSKRDISRLKNIIINKLLQYLNIINEERNNG